MQRTRLGAKAAVGTLVCPTGADLWQISRVRSHS
jgi:hypothetical protein